MVQNLVSKPTFQGFQFILIFCFIFNNIHDLKKPTFNLILHIHYFKSSKKQAGLRTKKKPRKRAKQAQAEHQLTDILRIFLFNSSSINYQKSLQLLDAKVTQSTVFALPSLTSKVIYGAYNAKL